jgi:hypothetical protein
MRVLLLCLPVLLFASCRSEQKESKEETVYKQTIFDKLSKDDLLEFELTANFDSLIFYKEDEEYYPATFKFKDESDSLIIKKINVRTRGETRKNICELPPLRLKFSKPLLKKYNLAKYKTLKLVTPCNDRPGFEDLITKELLCYQMYQELTGQSFRVQPARVRIKQKESDESSSMKTAFLIEHDKEMAKRLGGKLLNKSIMKIKSIDVKSYNLLVLFQYMIGNTDWNLSKRHNIKLVQMKGNSAPVPVPYDFDYSGLVNAKYAIPHPSLPIENIRERLFQWRGKDVEMLKEPIARLLEKKEALLRLIGSCQLENKEDKTLMINYVKSFFEIIESEDGMDVLTRRM